MRIKVISYVICALMIATVLVVEVPKDVSAQIVEEWVARYNGSGNEGDAAVSITSDSIGNVYVTGWSVGSTKNYDYSTIAYDSSGNELWEARYNGPENSNDEPWSIVTDSLGNVYVIGSSWNGYTWNGGTDNDYVTVAYDLNGNELWVARYDGPANGKENGRGIAIDSSSGNIYVTGESIGNGTGFDLATIAYDSSGKELWVARYNGLINGNDNVYYTSSPIFVDSLSGNIYVTGYSEGKGTDYDYVTIAYDSYGNELWVTRYDGPVNGSDKVWAIAADSLGYVYITGQSEGNGTDWDYATVAYDSLGNELWVARYNGPGNGRDVGCAITTDPYGNVYVTGSGYGTGFDYTTIAYDSDGNELWVAIYNGPGNDRDAALSIATDQYGNIYITGTSNSGITVYDNDYAIVAYDSLGNELWVARYNGPGDGNDFSTALALDSIGNVYVTGGSMGIGAGYASDYDYATIKYSQQKPILQTTINIEPDTLNLKSKGRWITCYIDLPEGYDVNDIDISTILLEDTIPAEWGDVQGDTLMVKFDRSEVEDMLSPGTYHLKVTGELTDGTEFEGYGDEIRVIDPGK